MDNIRKAYQGVWNIVRFNWHYYLLAGIVVISILLIKGYIDTVMTGLSYILIISIVLSILISLGVSFYIYDVSALYKLSWLAVAEQGSDQHIVNISAGFDETSGLLLCRYPEATLSIFDFYDPARHTEVSIKRARKAYPEVAGTQRVNTTHLPMKDAATDTIFLILAAHEIRDDKERVMFFTEISRILKDGGQIVVTEHLRDIPNFLAYNIGCFHFHSKAKWIATFNGAGLTIVSEIKVTPFISTFILEKHGTAY